ncbi:MAG: hypothetical protein GDA41_00685 [Rhodospirillales bacterium]|nr:hypothetical protein [Rhodospirillales bacterium]
MATRIRFADTLRMMSRLLCQKLRFPGGDHLPSEAEIVRLRVSTVLAVDHVMSWVDRHGIDKLDTPKEDSAARQGWPDETGGGWTPPCDILGIDRPDYWGKPTKTD